MHLDRDGDLRWSAPIVTEELKAELQRRLHHLIAEPRRRPRDEAFGRLFGLPVAPEG
ncbi:hypothetical protein [Sorangium cellulosum]|uniref:hypothetical protein n=1 Tax=Sorangium cellulosum TaxID=56 RepID=UPI000ABEC474|nr:hypothetical protein [Sorangium cellulosum]